jgi:hypothetical protein
MEYLWILSLKIKILNRSLNQQNNEPFNESLNFNKLNMDQGRIVQK